MVGIFCVPKLLLAPVDDPLHLVVRNGLRTQPFEQLVDDHLVHVAEQVTVDKLFYAHIGDSSGQLQFFHGVLGKILQYRAHVDVLIPVVPVANNVRISGDGVPAIGESIPCQLEQP